MDIKYAPAGPPVSIAITNMTVKPTQPTFSPPKSIAAKSNGAANDPQMKKKTRLLEVHKPRRLPT